MARAHFVDTLMYVDSVSGDLKPANNARVSVYAPGTTTPQTIYTTRSAGTTKANPFTTGADGAAEFWAEIADYDVKIEDLNVPTRFGTKTIGWQSSNPTFIPYTSMDPIAVRQDVPIGGVIAWWRPTNAISVPTGYAVCDGATVTSANHDFGTGASIVLPDLRNAFILGANVANTDGQTDGGSDTVASAPGIRGTGGSQSHTLTATQIPTHTHSLSVSGTTDSQGNHAHTTVAAHGTGGNINYASGGLSHAWHIEDAIGSSTAGAHTHNVSATGTSGSAGSGASHPNIPRYVGLLYIMKIKRN